MFILELSNLQFNLNINKKSTKLDNLDTIQTWSLIYFKNIEYIEVNTQILL